MRLIPITHIACTTAYYGLIVGLVAIGLTLGTYIICSSTTGQPLFTHRQHNCPCGGFAADEGMLMTRCMTCGRRLWIQPDWLDPETLARPTN